MDVEKRLEELSIKFSALEKRYAKSDFKRLKEFRQGGITQRTARKHTEICQELESVYAEMEKLKKKNGTSGG